MSHPILVTGATGHAGGEVARQLLAAGQPVRVLVRSRAKAEALAQAGAEIVEGDLEHAETIGPALAGIRHALLSTAAAPNLVEIHTAFIRAAQQAGLEHVVKVSAVGASSDSQVNLSRWHAASDQALQDSGVGWTILQPTFFSSNLLAYAPTVQRQGVFYGCMGEGRAPFVDVRDIAAVAVTALTQPGHMGQAYELTGPEALTYSEVAALLSRLLGKDVRYVDLPACQIVEAMEATGMPDWFAFDIAGLQRMYADGGLGVSDAVERVCGRAAIRLEQFLQDHLAAFQEGPPASHS